MEWDEPTGVWSVTGDETWKGKYYLYEVKVFVPSTGKIETNLVTDPYSISLSMNGVRSQVVDLNDTELKPQGWDSLPKPPLAAPEDIVLYELHIRDFSISDATVPEELRGTYKAFTVKDSNGMKHLADLAEAGLTHIHLLPAFDIASVNEDKSTWQTVDEGKLKALPPDSDGQSIAVSAITGTDGFNWGYDPLHYTTPEGSYATDPNGTPRIVEFREMVQSLNESGLRVVMDVVYNHTNASGQSDNSVLDRVVPGYYHRLNTDGNVEKSTCCENTATEHDMMRKLMIDSVLTWAKDYKVDGFRFDLMGHHMLDDMIALRAALDLLTLEKDGVDGKSIYVYGEAGISVKSSTTRAAKTRHSSISLEQASACSMTVCAMQHAAAIRSTMSACRVSPQGLSSRTTPAKNAMPKISRSCSTTTLTGSVSDLQAILPVMNSSALMVTMCPAA